MKTLIFKSDRDAKARFYNSSKKVEFVKEGSIQDALTHFDGSRFSGDNFYYSETEEGFNPTEGETWYYCDCSGNVILRSTDVKESGAARIDVDPGANKYLWTTPLNELDTEEIEALIEGHEIDILKEYFEATGKTKEEIEVANLFDDFKTLDETPNGLYISENFESFEDEPENAVSFKYNSKYYVKA